MKWVGWVAGLLAALAAGVGIALWRAPKTIEVPDAPASPSVEAPVAPTPSPRPRAMPAPPDMAAVPPGLSAGQWAALQAELAGRPDELRRVVAYLGFAADMQRWRAGSGDRAALARRLDAGLDDRLRQRELSAGEARLIKAALLEQIEPDPARRAAALARWESQWAAPPVQRSAAEAEFQRRQAEIVAAWQALPAARRDPKALERQLDALRVAMFASPAPEGGGSR